MVTIDEVRNAKKSFLDDFINEIMDETGYHLAAGLGKPQKEDEPACIAASIITTEETIPESVKTRIYEIIGEKYEYLGEEISIDLRYVTNFYLE